MAGDATGWRGVGRWLAYVLGALLLVYGIPLILVPDGAVQALAGWNILLGLLIGSAVASDYRHADRVAVGLALLLALRLAIALVVLTWSAATLSDVLLFVLGSAVAADLRRQKRASA
jgi:hypothetical protein